MTTGRILVDGAFEGIGFAIAPTLALTAMHVVRGALDSSDSQSPDHTIEFLLSDGVSCAATVSACSRRLDVASLHLKTAVSDWLEPAVPKEGGPWWVDSRPRDNDPMLTGSITSCARPLVTDNGEEALLLQLDVEQSVGDFAGYSGSPVRFGAGVGGDLVGILIEQARWRRREPSQLLTPVANILYAVPIDAVIALLDIQTLTTLNFDLLTLRTRMDKIKAIESEVDQELVREVRKEVIFRYVFGEQPE